MTMSISISRIRRLLLAGGAMAATVLGVQLAVHAEKNVKEPGTFCSPIKGDIGKINYTNTSVINESTSSAKVMCPVIFHADSVNRPGNMFPRVIDRNTSANITCRVFGFPFDNVDTGQVWQSPQVSTSGTTDPITGNTLQDMDDGSGDGIVLTDVMGFVLTMTCTLPGAPSSSTRSEIVNYQLGQST
jgi:hypothetical protein